MIQKINPKISIITVVYNAAKTLNDTIQSVANQSYKNIEYIIIDGNSTDGTVEIIKENSDKIDKWVSEKDSGIYDAMNKGIKLCTGDWIYFLGADDILFDKDVISNVANLMTINNQIVYGNVIYTSNGRLYDGSFNQFKIVTRNICHQAIFYPKSVFLLFEYNINYKLYADFDLNLKLFNNKNWIFKYTSLVIAHYNNRGTSGSYGIDDNFKRDFLEIVKRNFPVQVYLYRLLRTKLAELDKRIHE